MDDTERYAYGHSAKGKRCYAEKPGSKSIRINFMGGLRGKQFIAPRKRRYLGRYFAHPMMQNRRAKRDDYKPSAVRVTQRYVP
ncbi:hypothetical protein PsalMR5_02132 [Piscirickettsia salmonis]|nr:hypothetical protein PsalSR1_01976 [Piscirickettsia salmonis]QGP64265.1 hypothetical protein PsalMR5_02132 [Piscirickettsia salmonis]